MYRVDYDFARPNWRTFGHQVYVESPEFAEVAIRAHDGADVTITRMEIREAHPGEAERYAERRARRDAWQANVRQGIPNHRGDL